MPPESKNEKAKRLLREQRLAVVDVHAEPTQRGPDRVYVRAQVRGDSGATHVVMHVPRRGWTCTCPATTRCSHIIAVQHVVDVNPPEPTPPARTPRWVPATEPAT